MSAFAATREGLRIAISIYRPHRPSSEWQVGFGLPQLASSSAGNFETPVYYPDPDMMREELHRILAEARAAKTIPWGREPHGALSRYLPADDGVFAGR